VIAAPHSLIWTFEQEAKPAARAGGLTCPATAAILLVMLYNPPHFRQTETGALLDQLATVRFATLVSNAPQGPVVTHMPLIFDRQAGPMGTLIGHLARANPHWTVADLDTPSIVLVHGPDAYVSPSWYPSKRETGKVVPTWNYSVLHVTGRLSIHTDPEWLLAAVSRLTDHHERDFAEPWAVMDAPPAFLAAQLKGIVGISLTITGIEGKSKLSQNRPEADQAGVVAGLAEEADPGSAAVLALMRGRTVTP